MDWESLPQAILPSGMKTMLRMPGAGGVGGHSGGGIAGGGAGDPLEAAVAATERAAVMPVSLKEPVGFMP